MGLLDYRQEDAALGGAPAARGCSIGERKKLLLGELPLRGAAGLQTGGGCFWWSSRCAGLLDRRKEEAALGGAPAARGCPLEQGGRSLFLGELPLRGAAGIQRRGGCSWGSSRCAGLLDRRKEEAALGGAPAARGCPLEQGGRRLFLGELPLRGAAGIQRRGGCSWGSSSCAGLLDWRKEEAAFGGSSRCAGLLDYIQEDAALGGAPASQGCSIGGRRKLLWGELPLRGAAGLHTGGCCFGGSSRFAGLLDRRKEEAALGGAPAARGCPLEQGGRRLFLGELPLRGAAGIHRRGGCSWGSSRCAGLLDWRKEEAAFGGSSRCAGLLDYRQEEAAFGGAPAARGCLIGENCGCFWGSPSCVGLAGCWVEGKKRLLLGEAASGAARGFSSRERKRLTRDDGSSCIIFEKCHDNILRRVVSNSGVGMGKDICTSASLLLACRIYVSM